MKTINYKEVSKIFNSSSLASLSEGDYSFVEYVSRSLFSTTKIASFTSFFNEVFNELNRGYRTEYIYKNFLVLRHLLGRHSVNTSTMLSEFRVGSNKADCVILNGKSTCYEIKTEYDSLIRLNDQVKQYRKLFDEVYVVCSEKNCSDVIETLEQGVGILILSDRSYFKKVREPCRRKGGIDREALVKSLRKAEYQELAFLVSGKLPSATNAQLFSMCRELVLDAEEDDLAEGYLAMLKKHRAVKNHLIDFMPFSLKNAAVSYRFTQEQEKNLISIFRDKA
ncbi:sce7726 family protein [Microbulbifer elongatus]|uniref:sce7726 family protein n=1 Tax=Microbulbifer elongatus TaxID=86173 RepID=UPI001E422CC9|nr:sce7726 family protein [Microbulbifer elongatus]